MALVNRAFIYKFTKTGPQNTIIQQPLHGTAFGTNSKSKLKQPVELVDVNVVAIKFQRKALEGQFWYSSCGCQSVFWETGNWKRIFVRENNFMWKTRWKTCKLQEIYQRQVLSLTSVKLTKLMRVFLSYSFIFSIFI